MLPAPPASCAGWWFYQLLKALWRERPALIKTWHLIYSSDGSFVATPLEPNPHSEVFQGSLQDGSTDRRCGVSWEWPGDDGNLHTSAVTWQPGEMFVRPLTWRRRRRPIPPAIPDAEPPPWPLNVSVDIRGGHGQVLEQASIRAWQGLSSEESALRRDAATHLYELTWASPWGEFRLPITDLPCTLSRVAGVLGRNEQALTLAGLTLAWRIDLDREAWTIWRRFSGSTVLDDLGGPNGSCPDHGLDCPWPSSGRTS